ncbi:hypothetical protein BJ170DRAFT_624809 [Xylariales sp. AK1849]|nr:hypothetical protein BJ170DRAFT_624809 [Xylariales sp. AK1849]
MNVLSNQGSADPCWAVWNAHDAITPDSLTSLFFNQHVDHADEGHGHASWSARDTDNATSSKPPLNLLMPYHWNYAYQHSPTAYSENVGFNSNSYQTSPTASLTNVTDHAESMPCRTTNRRMTKRSGAEKYRDKPPKARTNSLTEKGSQEDAFKRERNRTAAAKCRANSKVAEEELRSIQKIEQERNTGLRVLLDRLLDEQLALEHELLCHSGCKHKIIDRYLLRKAEEFGERLKGTTTD